MMIIVTCASCKAEEPYKVTEYLNYLAIKSGIGSSTKIEDNFESLLKWKVVIKTDSAFLNDDLDYAFMSKIICNLLEEKGNPIDILYSKGWIESKNENKKVSKDIAEDVVNKAIEIINNKEFEKKSEYKYNTKIKDIEEGLQINDIIYDSDNNEYLIVKDIDNENIEYEDATYEQVFSYMDIADSYVVDFSEAEVIPLQEEIQTSYINNKYNLLASKNHVFNKDGFRISYSINSSGIDVHVSKSLDKGTIYADGSINKVNPTFKWTYDKGDLKNCYFNLKMNTTMSLGATIGKYGNYYIKLKDLDSSSFMNTIKSMIVPKSDEVEATIPICEIKTPIPDIPFAYLNMRIGIKLYASGKIELIMYNAHNIGFEVKDGNARYFYDHDDDLDSIIKASGKAALAINFGLDASKFRLCDIEFDGGIKAETKATVHLYDTDFNEISSNLSDVSYSTLDEVSKENPYVKICGDVSLYWLLDLMCNTSKSVLYKMGFSKIYHILDDNNQVFGNLHHIENGEFVKTCTRKTKTAIKNEILNINTNNKIVLNTYAEVINVNDSFQIEIVAIPNGYQQSDIIYTSSDSDIAIIENDTIKALKPGTCKVNVHTSDGKYNSYINVLVSTG